MARNSQTQTQKTLTTASIKPGFVSRISTEYNEYLASYPGAQVGVISAVLLIIVSIIFFLLQNI